MMIIPVITLMVLATMLAPVSAKSIRADYKLTRKIKAAHADCMIDTDEALIGISLEVYDVKEKGSPRALPLIQKASFLSFF